MAGALRHAKLSYGRNLRPHRCFRNCGCHVAAWEWRICSGSLLPTPAKRDHTGNGPYYRGGSPQLSKLVRTAAKRYGLNRTVCSRLPPPECMLCGMTSPEVCVSEDVRFRRGAMTESSSGGFLDVRYGVCTHTLNGNNGTINTRSQPLLSLTKQLRMQIFIRDQCYTCMGSHSLLPCQCS